MMDVLITWDFEIRWLWNFSPFFWWKQRFLMVLWRFIAHRCQRRGTKNNNTHTKKIPYAWRRERKEDNGTSVAKAEEQTTRLTAAETSRFAAVEDTRSQEAFGQQHTPSWDPQSSCPISWPGCSLFPGQLPADWALRKQSIMWPA